MHRPPALIIGALVASLGLITACSDEPSGDAKDDTTESAPEFNYIPDYSNACLPQTTADIAQALTEVAAQTNGDVFLAATHLEVCSDHMTSKCAPCSWDPEKDEYNALGHLLGEFGTWGHAFYKTGLADQKVDTKALEKHVSQALSYPWRQLTVHGKAGDATTIRLSPTQASTCELAHQGGGAPCKGATHYFTTEGLDKTCKAFRDTVPGKIAVEKDASGAVTKATVESTGPGKGKFGFQVPLITPLPPTSAFESTGTLQAFINRTPSITMQVSAPQVSVSTASDGTLCGRLTGKIAPSVFQGLAKDKAALVDYTDDTGFIPVILTMQLRAVSVSKAGNP